MAEYADTNPISDYEEDHLIPLELGGSPTSPLNLWPEPGHHRTRKTPWRIRQQRSLRRAHDPGCGPAGHRHQLDRLRPATRRQRIATAASSPPTRSSASAATCTVTASYSSEYNDFDVYVHSNQPDQAVSVTTSGAPVRHAHGLIWLVGVDVHVEVVVFRTVRTSHGAGGSRGRASGGGELAAGGDALTPSCWPKAIQLVAMACWAAARVMRPSQTALLAAPPRRLSGSVTHPARATGSAGWSASHPVPRG